MSTNCSGETKGISSVLLCLKCRRAGHSVEKCPSTRWAPEFEWFFSQARMEMDFGSTLDTVSRELCKRCQDLNVLQLLDQEIPWRSAKDLNKAMTDGSEYFRVLGQTGSVEFRKDCPLCCCLFAMTPNPSSNTQKILIFPDWTINRLTGETDVVTDTEEYHQFSKCLLISLDPSTLYLEFAVRAHRGDALCVIEKDNLDHSKSLGGRRIDPQNFCTSIVEDWLSACSRLHWIDCRPVWTEELDDIRLLDVSTREIVRYPKERCDYIALSYVWGPLSQKSYQLGSSLGRLPQTIEDAIVLVQKLGKRFLWVDSLCIDQEDDADKRHQIDRMWSIYHGALITIIALSSDSVNSGIPRLCPSVPINHQLTCSVDGKQLVSLMPTLTQQIWMSRWGSRAWTLQEALGSPRCLYISDSQCYFECNAVQCCESLDQTKSWVHNLSLISTNITEAAFGAKIGAGCLRNSSNPKPSNRILHYGAKLALYSYRSMTEDADGLNAFSGILQHLEVMYEGGFFQGLPVADFQWGLLWRSQEPPERRPGFPTWSWAGWKAAMWPGLPKDITNPHQFPLPISIWKAKKSQLVPLFKSLPQRGKVGKEIELPLLDDPVAIVSQYGPEDVEFDFRKYPAAEAGCYLFIEAIMFQFIPDYSRPVTKVYGRGRYENFAVSLRGTMCLIKIMSTDLEIKRSATTQTRQQFLLLARDRINGWIHHHLLLLLFPEEGLAVRGTVLELIVPEDHLEVLAELEPQKRRVVLS